MDLKGKKDPHESDNVLLAQHRLLLFPLNRRAVSLISTPPESLPAGHPRRARMRDLKGKKKPPS